ncbi:MAG: bifunctional 4-hydroxy-2-oxoglutarate aldolase/2-dehydro-3-deoxy-phosphogluconate aldolase [Thermomicrobium sp.]|nr:bifunctional 4-hydroxy-2-oxoglutarate aldolase/2-dehydro-3-deoxy-phosphogluconate aldolase [Thermomicrobium sp.]MDW8060298.1 bifunctional 4-hydroxy-2-oxoglutarate aldolase/2-dehydro-3-deoxy-phosphogluconate aldolase [Thermomicrobium sp.]
MHWIERYRLIAVVRLDDLACAEELAEALLEGGVRVLEFTYTNREAGRAIERVRRRFEGDCLVGAGTVLDAETARHALLSGAQFVVTPTLRRETIELCRRYSVTSVIGAFTPTEILTAWEWGADYVKVNPASLAGPSYFRDVLAPLPQVKLVPSGGVTLETAPAFLAAGAVAVAVGSHLVDRRLVAERNWDALRERARTWAELVARPDSGVPAS